MEKVGGVKCLLPFHGLAKFGIVDACKPFKIKDFEGTSHSEAKPHQNLAKLGVARRKLVGQNSKLVVQPPHQLYRKLHP